MVTKETFTKKVLETKEEGGEKDRVPLYSKKALEIIAKESKRWQETKLPKEDQDNFSRVHHSILGSEIPKRLVYTPLDISGLDYLADSGLPGEEPFVRGVHPNMYRGRQATLRPLVAGGIGGGGPEEQNTYWKIALERGATGLQMAFNDVPQLQLCGYDDPQVRGQVGRIGGGTDTVDDWHILLKDIPLKKVSLSITGHYPTNSLVAFAGLLVWAEETGMPWDQLIGSTQNDVVMEEVVRTGYDYLPAKDVFRIQCDNAEFMQKHTPKWNSVTLNGYNLREAGTSGITEIAVAFVNGIDMIKELQRRGVDINRAAERIAFFWSFSQDFFDEIARIRAARRLWYKILKYQFGATNPRAMLMRSAVQTAGVSLRREEPLNNIARATMQGLAAVLAGVQSFHIDCYDEAYSPPSDEAGMVALRSAQIIQNEIGVHNTVDPMGGSYYVEALTEEFEQRILEEIDEMQRLGGIIGMIESGWLHRKIAEYASREQKLIESGELKIVGYNCYKTALNLPEIAGAKYVEGAEERILARQKKIRETRDNKKVEEALAGLSKACKTSKNLVPYTMESARVRATLGEMFGAIKDGFGFWDPPTRYKGGL
jgi:methylmalonyl-CoA mutase N-terminal domain/subunit